MTTTQNNIKKAHVERFDCTVDNNEITHRIIARKTLHITPKELRQILHAYNENVRKFNSHVRNMRKEYSALKRKEAALNVRKATSVKVFNPFSNIIGLNMAFLCRPRKSHINNTHLFNGTTEYLNEVEEFNTGARRLAGQVGVMKLHENAVKEAFREVRMKMVKVTNL